MKNNSAVAFTEAGSELLAGIFGEGRRRGAIQIERPDVCGKAKKGRCCGPLNQNDDEGVT